MHNKAVQQGFSFLELMIVFALLALLGAFAVPNLFRIQQGAQRKEFLSDFEGILKDGVLRSIVEQKMHQIYIDIAHEVIQLREYDPQSSETNRHKKFKKVRDTEYVTEIKFLNRFVFKNFFINQVDEMVVGSAMQDVMFYIMPDGSSQAIIANVIDQDEENSSSPVSFSVVINPFYARMSVYDTFQKP